MGFTPNLMQQDDHLKVIALMFSHIQTCFISHPQSRKCKVRRTLQNCGSSILKFLHVAFLTLSSEVAPRYLENLGSPG